MSVGADRADDLARRFTHTSDASTGSLGLGHGLLALQDTDCTVTSPIWSLLHLQPDYLIASDAVVAVEGAEVSAAARLASLYHSWACRTR